MSADLPGTTTYSAGFGDRTGTLRKADPFSSRPITPRAPAKDSLGNTMTVSPRSGMLASTQASSPRFNSSSPVNPELLCTSLSEQYRVRVERDEFSKIVKADAAAFAEEERARSARQRRNRCAYGEALQEQIREHSASKAQRQANKKEELQQSRAQFDAFRQEREAIRADQRRKHQEYLQACSEVQDKNQEAKQLVASDEQIAAAIVAEDQRLKNKEEEAFQKRRAAQREQLQAQMKEDLEMLKQRSARRAEKKAKEEDYVQFLTAMEKDNDEKRKLEIFSHQKHRADYVSLPSLTNNFEASNARKPDTATGKGTGKVAPPKSAADMRRDLVRRKVEYQKWYANELEQQVAERNARKEARKNEDLEYREAAEKRSRDFKNEIIDRKLSARQAAQNNERDLAAQISSSLQRQFRLSDEEALLLTTSSAVSPRSAK